ncbi:MAG: hypothetical protein QOG56_2433 [Solirubrobacteraceae bacterium]|nr:hypothetical protein [Solirubrobacteraceae bacterium]
MWRFNDRARSGAPASGVDRRSLVALALIGLALAAAPLIFGMFEKGPKGTEMLEEFKPFMTDERLGAFQRHIRNIDAGVREADAAAAAVLEGTGAAAHARFERRFPEVAQFHEDWPPIDADMTDLLVKIRANVGNYEAVEALPSFTIFPWLFVVPGLLVALLALVAALVPRGVRQIRWAVVVVGIGLALTPVVMQMFDRAPRGGRMMTTFKTIETREKVEAMQGYFGAIAVGQGALRLQLVPALRRDGLDAREIARRLPAITTLNRSWIAILNDMTPMIGAMSDNVDNYQALMSLPPFRLFPWFFVAPGLLIAGLALAGGRRGRRTPAPATATGPVILPSTPA